MRFLIFTLVGSLTVCPVLADSYTGVVSEVKHFHNGGIAVDLDGAYPREKIDLYVPPANATAIGTLPNVGAKVTATGSIASYRGRPEMKIYRADQWSW